MSRTTDKLREDGNDVLRKGEGVRRDVERLGNQVNELRGSFGELVADVQDLLRVEIRQRPWIVLGGAAAIGWSLGYVLPSWLVRAGIGVGRRAATTAIAQQVTAQALQPS